MANCGDGSAELTRVTSYSMSAGTSEVRPNRECLDLAHTIALQGVDAADTRVAEAPVEYTILVIEDDEASAALACSILEDAGYAVTLAGSGAQGIEAFQRVNPHCILLDGRLPFLDGYETCRKLRALPGGFEVPIVFMTAERSVASFNRAYACGADDFLTKPIAPNELLDHVCSGLALGRLRASDDYAISRLARGLERGARLNESDLAKETWIQARERAATMLDLPDVGEAREGKLIAHREQLNLPELLEQLLADFRPLADSRGITLESCIFATSAKADEKLMRRVLAHLLDSALQHAPRGTTVLVTASPRAEHTEICVVDVCDGISSARRTEVFDAFSEMGAGAADGRGLGLMFCRWAVETHGGRIWIEDGSPGCVIRLALPTKARRGVSVRGSVRPFVDCDARDDSNTS